MVLETKRSGDAVGRLDLGFMTLTVAKGDGVYIKAVALRHGDRGRRIQSTAQENNGFACRFAHAILPAAP